MTDDKTTRRVYSAEELHRLRSTCSQPRLHEAIEENEGEDAELVKGNARILPLPCMTDIIGKQTSPALLRASSHVEHPLAPLYLEFLHAHKSSQGHMIRYHLIAHDGGRLRPGL